MRAPLRPVRLRPGDRVALLSPASAPDSAAVLARGAAGLAAHGLEVVPGPHALARQGYLAGADADRARDLTAAFRDPRIRAIFATRGGYGVSRLLERFDPAVARAHPKIVVGFSDLTLLHLALQNTGLVSFWGPMPCTFNGYAGAAGRAALQALSSSRPWGELPVDRRRARTLRRGRAEGRLTGGTLSLLAASLATPHPVTTRDRIVFLEDIGEEPYKIDRLLTQLLAAGRLRDAAGIALGRFTHAEPRVYAPGRSLGLAEVLADRLGGLGIPVFDGLAVGHLPAQPCLPYGVTARLDAGARELEIVESALRE